MLDSLTIRFRLRKRITTNYSQAEDSIKSSNHNLGSLKHYPEPWEVSLLRKFFEQDKVLYLSYLFTNGKTLSAEKRMIVHTADSIHCHIPALRSL